MKSYILLLIFMVSGCSEMNRRARKNGLVQNTRPVGNSLLPDITPFRIDEGANYQVNFAPGCLPKVQNVDFLKRIEKYLAQIVPCDRNAHEVLCVIICGQEPFNLGDDQKVVVVTECISFHLIFRGKETLLEEAWSIYH